MSVTWRRALNDHRFQSLSQRTLCRTTWLPVCGGSFTLSAYKLDSLKARESCTWSWIDGSQVGTLPGGIVELNSAAGRGLSLGMSGLRLSKSP